MKFILDCISDTHTKHDYLDFQAPVMDPEDVWILVHAGDFTHQGTVEQVTKFAAWLKTQPHHHKVVICGNHELLCDDVWLSQYKEKMQAALEDCNLRGDVIGAANAEAALTIPSTNVREILKDPFVHYLQEEGTEISGLRFWGSPYSRRFFDWAFQVEHDQGAEYWEKLPEADVVIVHGPPKWHGDQCPDLDDRYKKVFVGCPDFLNRLRVTQPALVVSGHIHPGFGVTYDDGTSVQAASGICMVNAASLTDTYKPHGLFIRVTLDENKCITSVVYKNCAYV